MAKIHQEVTFAASPAQIYRALTDADEYAKFTNAPAEVSVEEGGAFSAYGGRVLGRNLTLVPDTRIVQAWRAAHWPEGIFTIISFELKNEEGQTRLVFDQDAVPDDMVEHLEGGWKKMYWEPLRKYLES